MRVERGWVAVSAAATMVLSSCAGARPEVGTNEGDGAWRELVSAHFVVRTDVSVDSARRLVEELERQRALLVEAMPALGAATRSIPVFAYRSREEYWALTGARNDYIGQAIWGGWGELRVTMRISPGGDVEDHAVLVAHELTHAVACQVIPFQPRWFSEGLAEYLSSVARVRGGRRFVGSLPDRAFEGRMVVPVRELLAWKQEGQNHETPYYATAWLLVRTLATEDPSGFAELQRRLTDGEEPDQAWNASFPRWSLARADGPSSLDRLLRRCAGDLDGQPLTASPAVTEAPTERLLTPAEVFTWRFVNRRAWPPDELQREVNAALALDPGHVAALAAAAGSRGGRTASAALARRAVAAHPEDAAAWRFRAQGQATPGDREADLRRSEALAPDDPVALLMLADELALAKPAEAEPLAARAAALAPWSAHAHRVWAQALSRLGRCEEAAAEARRWERAAGAGAERALAAVAHRCGAPAERADALQFDAGLALDRGAPGLALELADASLALAPGAEGWNQRGRALEGLGRAKEAADAYRRATELAPAHRWAWRNLALLTERQGKLEEAEALYRKQVEVAPDEFWAQRSLGSLLLLRGRTEEALAPLERAARLAPHDLRAHVALARAQLAAGRTGPAVKSLEQFLARSSSALTLNEAAWVLADAGAALDRAAAWAEASVKEYAALNPLDAATTRGLANAWDTLGWVRYRQGRLSEAERWIAAAERLVPSAPLAEHLGAVLEKAGRPREAVKAYARACARDARSPARARLAAQAGEDAVPAAVQAAQAELEGATLAEVPGDGSESGTLELMLSADGKVAEVRTANGEAVPAAAAALRGARHGIAFPDPAVHLLAVKAAWRCTAGVCAARLGEEAGRPAEASAP